MRMQCGDDEPTAMKGLYQIGDDHAAADRCACGSDVMHSSDAATPTCASCNEPWPTVRLEECETQALGDLAQRVHAEIRQEEIYLRDDTDAGNVQGVEECRWHLDLLRRRLARVQNAIADRVQRGFAAPRPSTGAFDAPRRRRRPKGTI